MTPASFDFDAPDHFTTGAIGPQGERVFSFTRSGNQLNLAWAAARER